MITITNGINDLTVTRGAYEGVYKMQGYTIKGNLANNSSVATDSQEAQAETEEKANNSIQMADLAEKPISQWTKGEVKDFANANNISLDGTKSFNDAKELVKKFIEENV